MIRRPILLLLGCCAAAGLRGGPEAPAADHEVVVFAAASLTDALQDVARRYAAEGGDRLVFNFAASSTLARQIKEGAPADVFFSADEAKMDDLVRAGLVDSGTRRRLLANTLVIVVRADQGAAVQAAADLAGPAVRRLALAETKTVPAGIYARAWLEKAGLWAGVAAKVIPTENVRACLATVEAGDADAGIVYRTDALISRRVRVAWEVPSGETPGISYPVAVVKGCRHDAPARRLIDFLAAPSTRAIFAHFGFEPKP